MASLKKAIEMKCKECTYDPHAPGTWRDQTEQCTARTCPLWEVRPVTTATITLHRKLKGGDSVIDDILNGLEDEEEAAA